MNRSRLLLFVVLVVPIPLEAKPSIQDNRAREQRTKDTLEQIRKDCGITTGQFSYSAETGISLNFDGMIEPEKLQCASDRSTLLGIDFDYYDASASYSGPSRFIIKGPPARLDALVAQAVAAHWTVTHRANAGDGIAFLEIENPADASRKDVRTFLDRFSLGDFHDLAIGLAPRTLAGHDQLSTDTAFRSAARSMYKNLGTRSCGTPPGFDREALLRPDRDAVGALEQQLSSAPAGSQLAIAKEDAAYGLARSEGCWNDDELPFAKIHLEVVHKSVSSGVDRLRQLAPATTPFPSSAPANATEFRFKVARYFEWTPSLCTWTTKGSNEQVFAAALRELDALEAKLQGTSYAAHFAAAKADAKYDRSFKTAECDDPGSEPVAKLSAQALAGARNLVTELKALANLE